MIHFRTIFYSGFLCALLTLFLYFSDFSATAGAGSPSVKSGHQTSEESTSGPINASQSHSSDLGTHLPIWSCLPFAGMLFSIALWPLMAPDFWHHHFGKISGFWVLCMAIPFIVIYKRMALYEMMHILLVDYVPFIILLWSLYTVSGGILLRGTLQGTPIVNVIMLVIGTALASWMGTTGAAMLMIRPFLRANKHRKNRTFMVVFFIFLVGNVGGALTPLGDPPLFLGFLHGVPFFWTMNVIPHMITIMILLLVIYFLMDTYFFYKERKSESIRISIRRVSLNADQERIPLALEGTHNFIFLAGVVGAVLFSGMVDWGELNTLGIHRGVQDWIRDLVLILMGGVSLATTRAGIRRDNEFSWFPIQEVAYLFIGIFITMLPCLLILKAGQQGALAFLIDQVKAPAHYFWVTGALSSFLDNAPTYLTFFNSALGSFYAGIPETQSVALLINENSIYLKAITSGAVFFGACSYIGNAPNFMIRSIAEEAGTPMPSFFGYIIKFSLLYLIPCFAIVTWFFFI